MARKTKAERFNDYVVSKFEIYNSLFLKLPFDSIPQTSLLLPLFSDFCAKGYQADLSPKEIVNQFFKNFAQGMEGQNKHDLLFSFLKYIERQIVLFDAIEDAGFSYVNNMHGRGTLRYIKEVAKTNNNFTELKEYLNRFKVRIVLTAHPTQFYPGPVLGIITDLSEALKNDDLEKINILLTQLGKTRFFNKTKPSPLDEAVSLMWFLENVFYKSASVIYNYLEQHIFEGKTIDNSIFDFGFWPGGDRDGNPFVTPEITLETAKKLRFNILHTTVKFEFIIVTITFQYFCSRVGVRCITNILTTSYSNIVCHIPVIKHTLNSVVSDLCIRIFSTVSYSVNLTNSAFV